MQTQHPDILYEPVLYLISVSYSYGIDKNSRGFRTIPMVINTCVGGTDTIDDLIGAESDIIDKTDERTIGIIQAPAGLCRVSFCLNDSYVVIGYDHLGTQPTIDWIKLLNEMKKKAHDKKLGKLSGL